MNVTGVDSLIHGLGPAIKPTPGSDNTEFVGELRRLIDGVNDKQLKAEAAVKDFAAGKIENVHEVMLIEAEADISFRMLLQARNKFVEAYKEIMRMQI